MHALILAILLSRPGPAGFSVGAAADPLSFGLSFRIQLQELGAYLGGIGAFSYVRDTAQGNRTWYRWEVRAAWVFGYNIWVRPYMGAGIGAYHNSDPTIQDHYFGGHGFVGAQIFPFRSELVESAFMEFLEGISLDLEISLYARSDRGGIGFGAGLHYNW